MMESMEQGLTSQTLLGFQAITENKNEQIFPFEDIHDEFIEVKDKMRKSLA